MERSYLYYRDNHSEEVNHREKLPLPQRQSWRGSPSWRKATSTTEKVMVRKSTIERSFLYSRNNPGEEVMERSTSTTEKIMVRKSIMEKSYLNNRDNHGEEVQNYSLR
jgi:hypothetical protein